MPAADWRWSDQSGARPALLGDSIAGLIAVLHQMLMQLQLPKAEKYLCVARNPEKSYYCANPNLVANCYWSANIRSDENRRNVDVAYRSANFRTRGLRVAGIAPELRHRVASVRG